MSGLDQGFATLQHGRGAEAWALVTQGLPAQ